MKQEKLISIGVLLLLQCITCNSLVAQVQNVSFTKNGNKKEIVFPTRERILTKLEKEKIAQLEIQKQPVNSFESEAGKTVFNFSDVDLAPKFNDATFATIGKFMLANINMNVPAELNASADIYNVEISFVVMRDGGINFIKPITKFAYGMEEEVIRVLKMTNKKWSAALKNNITVMCEKKLVVTFNVL